MSAEIIKIDDIPRSKFSSGRHNETYEKWFAQVFALKEDEALKITLDRVRDPSLPTDSSLRNAIKKWNTRNPSKKIKKIVTNQRGGKPVIYLFPERREEESQRKKRKEA